MLAPATDGLPMRRGLTAVILAETIEAGAAISPARCLNRVSVPCSGSRAGGGASSRPEPLRRGEVQQPRGRAAARRSRRRPYWGRGPVITRAGTVGNGVKWAFVKEAEATDRLMATHGAVTAMRLLGYAYKLDTLGEEWLREHISRQQLNHVRERFAEAGVPFEPGTIRWPKMMQPGLRLAAHADRVKAGSAARKAMRRPGPA